MSSVFRRVYTSKLLRALCIIDGLSRYKEEQLTTVKRLRRIKLAADLSLALTSNATVWSHALLTNYISQQKTDKRLVKEIVGNKRFNDLMRVKISHAYYSKHQLLCSHGLASRRKKYIYTPRILSRNIIHRSIHRKNSVYNSVGSCPRKVALKSIVNERKLLELKRVIPGGESMKSSSCFLRDAADYIVSLRTQVQVMHSLVYHSSTQPLS